MTEKKQKKKTNPFITAIFFVVLMLWLFYSDGKMNIWLSGFVALLLTAALVVVTMFWDKRKG